MDILAYNRRAWDREVELGNPWTVPVGPEAIAAARRGEWRVVLTPTKPVPRDWFPELVGLDLLCLASGGGQQGPLRAAAGARVTVLDNSPRQLAQDRHVAERASLDLRTVVGDMADLSMFPDGAFGLIFHPVSNCFAPAVGSVWREAFRVLRPGGALLAGFFNPVTYIFDLDKAEHGVLEVRYRLPYSDQASRTEEELKRQMERGEPLEFSHSLADQIGGQLEAGFVIVGFYEDISPGDEIGRTIPNFIATRAVKLGQPSSLGGVAGTPG